MRRHISLLAMGLLSTTPVLAEAPSARIRALYASVPEDRVRASPRADILSHIDEMGRRRATAGEALAVPELDVELILRRGGASDLLMEPRVLEAIARMPPGRAAEVLRLIEDHRSGRNPVSDVPPLSRSDPGQAESLPLRGWVLARDGNGAPFIQNGDDPASRLLILPSMILGDLGRILSIQDDPEAFRVTLESGEVLEGDVRVAPPAERAGAEAADPPAAERVMDDSVQGTAAAPAGPEASPGPDSAPASSPRPRSRPAGLLVSAAPETALTPVRAASPGPGPDGGALLLRPRPRPAGLGG